MCVDLLYSSRVSYTYPTKVHNSCFILKLFINNLFIVYLYRLV